MLFDLPALRAYQDEALGKARQGFRSFNRIVLQAETGAGKTVMALWPLASCYEMGKRALFIARGRTLVTQTCRHLAKAGIPHGVFMSGHGWNDEPIQIASKDTLHSRCVAGRLVENSDPWEVDLYDPEAATPKVVEKLAWPKADLVIIDECHEFPGWQKMLMGVYPKACILGLTATPLLRNGKGLGGLYDHMVCAAPTSQLIKEGHIVPGRVYSPFTPDLKGVKVNADGEYSGRSLAKVMHTPKLVGDAVRHWQDYAEGRPTIATCCTIEHAKDVCSSFRAAGVPWEHIDQGTPDDEREFILKGLADGRICGVTNVGVLGRGVDVPAVSCVMLLRAFRSLVLFRQAIGRAKRPHPGKKDYIILDHSGAVFYHGLPDEDIEWSLTGGKVEELRAKDRAEGKLPRIVTCEKCFCQFHSSKICPACGTPISRTAGRRVAVKPGKLVEVDQDPAVVNFEMQKRFWLGCLYKMANRRTSQGHSSPLGAAAQMFHQKFQKFPWQIAGLPHVPDDRQLWKLPVSEVFPTFVRRHSA